MAFPLQNLHISTQKSELPVLDKLFSFFTLISFTLFSLSLLSSQHHLIVIFSLDKASSAPTLFGVTIHTHSPRCN